MKQILGIGDPCMDFLVSAPELPSGDKAMPLLQYGWQGGGKVATAMAAAGRLGGNVSLIGGVGSDDFGKFCIADLKRHNVNTDGIFIDEGTGTEFCVCISEPVNMTRALIYRRGGARNIAVEDFDDDAFRKADIVHLPYLTSHEVPHMDDVMIEACRKAHENHAIVSVDMDFVPVNDNDYRNADIIEASEVFYKKRFGDSTDYEAACREMLDLGLKGIIFTLGPKGSVGMGTDEPFFFAEGYKVKVVDTTGAGDVFHGAFLYGLANDWSLSRSAQFANAVAAIKCTRLGGRVAIPQLETALHFMETGEIDYRDIDKRVEFYGTDFKKE